MGEECIKKVENKYMIECIMRWLLFGVVIVVGPTLIIVWYKIIVGIVVDFAEYITDILIIVVSVCCNFINMCVDSKKRILYFLRWLFGIVCGFASVGALGLYILMCMYSVQLEALFLENLFYLATAIIIFCTVAGSIIEANSNRDGE